MAMNEASISKRSWLEWVNVRQRNRGFEDDAKMTTELILPANRRSVAIQNNDLSGRTGFTVVIPRAKANIAKIEMTTPLVETGSFFCRWLGFMTGIDARTTEPIIRIDPVTCNGNRRSPKKARDITITNGEYKQSMIATREAPRSCRPLRNKASAMPMPKNPLIATSIR